MDDLKKQKIKRINKVVDKVINSADQILNRQNLEKLYNLKFQLLLKINDTTRSDINRLISKQQLKDVTKDIENLEQKLQSDTPIDLSIDEVAAKEYIINNENIFKDAKTLINSNDKLDRLENELYKKD